MQVDYNNERQYMPHIYLSFKTTNYDMKSSIFFEVDILLTSGSCPQVRKTGKHQISRRIFQPVFSEKYHINQYF
jgi:hypothetical protein